MDSGRPSILFHLFRLAKLGWIASALLWSPAILGLSIEAAYSETYPMVGPAAQPRSTALLYELCKSTPDDQVNWCEGYLMGLADILLAMGISHIAGGICNAEYGPATLRRVFEIWVERHPDRLQEDMAVSAQAAFNELWPCRLTAPCGQVHAPGTIRQRPVHNLASCRP